MQAEIYTVHESPLIFVLVYFISASCTENQTLCRYQKAPRKIMLQLSLKLSEIVKFI